MKSVVIIGAGPAGLTAAYQLLKEKPDYHVTVLEATDRIGGISQTIRVGGNRMDMGGHRFFSKDPQVNAWWQELMPIQGMPAYDDKRLGKDKAFVPGGPDPEAEDRVMLIRERVSRIFYNHCFFDYPVSLSWSTFKGMGLGTTLKAGCSYLASLLHKLPETSLESFYINRFGRVLYSMFFEGYTEKLWGRHPRDISADWGAQRVKGLSILAVLRDIGQKLLPWRKPHAVETSLIEQFLYPKMGPGQLWELAAERICQWGGEIRMNSPVIGIHMEGASVQSVAFRTEEGEGILTADYVLSSMPVADLVPLLAKNNGFVCSPEVLEAALSLPYRGFVTVGLLVKGMKLTHQTGKKTLGGIVPDCWIYVQDTGVKLGRIQVFNNWSPYMVEKPEDTVWLGLEYFCTQGDAFWQRSDASIIAQAQEELVRIGVIDADAVLLAHCERIPKAYPAYFDSYAKMGEIVACLDAVQNLYCIGRNGQHRYNNMDHSMATAFAAVDCILQGREDKTAVWHVNTEQEYHEEARHS